MKIAIISAHPAPYRDVLLTHIANDKRIAADIYTLFPDDGKHDFGTRTTPYTTKLIARRGESSFRIFWRLMRLFLLSKEYDFIMWPCYVHWYERLCILFCILLKKKYGFGADSVEQPRIGKFAMFLKRMIVSHAELIHVPGCKSKNFFVETFGVSEDRVVCGAYAMDGNAIEKMVLGLREKNHSQIRAKIGVPRNATVFLMVANMISTRRYDVMCASFVRFAEKHDDCFFVAIGNGPELLKIQKVADIHPCIKVISGCSFDELLSYYAASDIYVHGGKEPASTALVIGAIAHLPLISSDAVGCSYDVVRDHSSGILVGDYESEEQWTCAFEEILLKREDWIRMGDTARDLSRVLDVDVAVNEFATALISA